jgi:hypothetical protein
MKNLNLILLCGLCILMMQCSPKNHTHKLENKFVKPDLSSLTFNNDIGVVTYSQNTYQDPDGTVLHNILTGVKITSSSSNSTNSKGKATIDQITTYTFSQNGYNRRYFTPINTSNLLGLNFYLSQQNNTLESTIIRGKVYDRVGLPARDVKVIVNGTESQIDNLGNYLITLPEINNYNIRYEDTGPSGTINTIEFIISAGGDDEIIVDVFIGGFDCCP